MHSPVEKSQAITLEAACDRVLDAFIDSFVTVNGYSVPPDRWLSRITEEMESAKREMYENLARLEETSYRASLQRAIKRVENVLEQLYEEALHY